MTHRQPFDDRPTGAAPRALMTPEQWERAVETLRLPPQQARIVALILQGKRDKQIALELGLSRPTVRTYLSRLFTRFGVSDRVGLALHVYSQCLTDADGPKEGGGGG